MATTMVRTAAHLLLDATGGIGQDKTKGDNIGRRQLRVFAGCVSARRGGMCCCLLLHVCLQVRCHAFLAAFAALEYYKAAAANHGAGGSGVSP